MKNKNARKILSLWKRKESKIVEEVIEKGGVRKKWVGTKKKDGAYKSVWHQDNLSFRFYFASFTSQQF